MAPVTRVVWSLALSALLACEADDLSGPLSGGRCGPNGECAKGYACGSDGECAKAGGSGGAAGSDGCGGCPKGQTCCGTLCADLEIDPQHCGQCDISCPNTKCLSGCTNECAPGYLDCDGNIVTNGCEVQGTSCQDAGV